MSKIIETLRSAVEHRERVSLDDIDVAALLAEFDSDTELMRQALEALDEYAYAKTDKADALGHKAWLALRDRLTP